MEPSPLIDGVIASAIVSPSVVRRVCILSLLRSLSFVPSRCQHIAPAKKPADLCPWRTSVLADAPSTQVAIQEIDDLLPDLRCRLATLLHRVRRAALQVIAQQQLLRPAQR